MRLAALLLLAACGDTATLVVDPMGAEQCDQYCADTIQVEVGGETISADCGEPIQVGEIAAGEIVTLAIRAIGEGILLTGTATVVAAGGNEIELSVQLQPSVRPRIDRITPSAPIAYGPITLAIDGIGFNDGKGDSAVTIDGKEVEAPGWRNTRIEATTELPGAVVVKSCGIGSDPFPVSFSAVRAERFDPFPDQCGEPKLVAGETGAAGDPIRAIFSCGDCESGMIVRLDALSDDPLDLYYGPTPGCPVDIALIDELDSAVVTSTGAVFECRGQVQTNGVACRGIEPKEGRVLDVSLVNNNGNLAWVFEEAGRRELWLDAQNYHAPILPQRFADVAAVDRRLVVGTSSLGTVLVEWTRSQEVPEGVLLPPLVPLGECAPIALRVHRPMPDRAVVICEGSGALEVERIRSSVLTVRVADFVDAAIDLDGRILWLWSSDRLSFVDMEEARALGSRPMARSYQGARLLRASDTNVFVVGGPAPGELTRLFVE